MPFDPKGESTLSLSFKLNLELICFIVRKLRDQTLRADDL